MFGIGKGKKDQDKPDKISKDEAKTIKKAINDRQETVNLQSEQDAKDFERRWKQFSGRGIKKIHLPITYSNVWTLLAKGIVTFLLKGNIYNTTPRGTDDRKQASIDSAVLNYHLYTIPSFQIAWIKNWFQAIISGWTVMKAGWENNSWRQGLAFSFILNSDIWYDPTANLSCDIDWYHQRQIITKQALKSLQDRNLFYFDKVKEFLKKADEYKKKNKVSEKEIANPYINKVELRECWVREGGGDIFKYVVGIVDNEAVTVLDKRKQKHKNFPYAIGTFAPDLEGCRGFGVPEILRSIHVAANAGERQKILAIDFAIHGTYLMKGRYDEKAIKMLKDRQPGDALHLPEGSSLERQDKAYVPRESFMQSDYYEQYSKNALGHWNPITGKEMQRKETLGGMRLLESKGSERQMAHLHIFAQALEYIGKYMFQLLFDHQDEKVAVKVWDEEESAEKWAEESIKRDENAFKDYNVILSISLSPTKAYDEASFFKLVELLSSDVFKGTGVDIEEMGKEAVEIVKPGYANKLFKGASQEAINKLRELGFLEQIGMMNIEDLGKIIRIGSMALQQGNQGNQGGLQQ